MTNSKNPKEDLKMDKPMFPSIKFDISGPSGNAFAIMSTLQNVLKMAQFEKEEINKILEDMKSSDYEHLCEVASRYIKLENGTSDEN